MPDNPEPYATRAWLLDGPIHSIPGILNWDGSMLTFIAYGGGTFFKKRLIELLKGFGEPTSSVEAIFNEEPTQVFGFDREAIQSYKFPWYYFKQGVKVTIQGEQLRFSFIQPQNTKLPPRLFGVVISEAVAKASVAHINAEKADGKRWRSIFKAITQ
jgi:hypothetical protein